MISWLTGCPKHGVRLVLLALFRPCRLVVRHHLLLLPPPHLLGVRRRDFLPDDAWSWSISSRVSLHFYNQVVGSHDFLSCVVVVNELATDKLQLSLLRTWFHVHSAHALCGGLCCPLAQGCLGFSLCGGLLDGAIAPFKEARTHTHAHIHAQRACARHVLFGCDCACMLQIQEYICAFVHVNISLSLSWPRMPT